MSDIQQRLENLEIKLRKLIQLTEDMRVENADLKSQLAEYKTIEPLQKKEIKDIEDSDNLVKLADKISDVELSAEMKKKLKKYIKEIDKCIALLSE